MRDSDNSLMVSADIHPEHTGRGYRSASILNSQPPDCRIKLVVSFALGPRVVWGRALGSVPGT